MGYLDDAGSDDISLFGLNAAPTVGLVYLQEHHLCILIAQVVVEIINMDTSVQWGSLQQLEAI